MQRKYYLAYGSNLNVRQMRYRCPEAKAVGTAVIEGYRLLFKGSKTGSYLTIEPAEGYCVPVAVWAVTGEDELALDRYEGYPGFYYKKHLPISYIGLKTGAVRTRDAFVYIMHEERSIGIPSMSYLDVCAEGYGNFGFDIAPLAEAYEYSLEGTK